MKPIKNLLLLTALLVLVYQHLGVVLVSEIKIVWLKLEHTTLNEEDKSRLVSLSFSENSGEIIWLNEYEFRYHGHLYDCYKKETKGNKIYLLAIPDAEEDFFEDLICSNTQTHVQLAESSSSDKLSSCTSHVSNSDYFNLGFKYVSIENFSSFNYIKTLTKPTRKAYTLCPVQPPEYASLVLFT